MASWARGVACWIVILSAGVVTVGCCKHKQKELVVGSEVEAPGPSSGTLYPGRIIEMYGKLAHIRFDDEAEGWALLSELDPPGKAGPHAAAPCAVQVGDRVMAPWSKTKSLYAGRVTEVYGKLALVSFDDGDRGWSLCSATQKQ